MAHVLMPRMNTKRNAACTKKRPLLQPLICFFVICLVQNSIKRARASQRKTAHRSLRFGNHRCAIILLNTHKKKCQFYGLACTYVESARKQQTVRWMKFLSCDVYFSFCPGFFVVGIVVVASWSLLACRVQTNDERLLSRSFVRSKWLSVCACRMYVFKMKYWVDEKH